jgi:hypothetical protein
MFNCINENTTSNYLGHKLHSHTHSYIHNGFYIAFKKIGFKTYYYDDNDDVSNHDFSNSLFITEHQVNKRIPLRQDCLYLTHYIDEGDYIGIPKENIIILKVTLRDFLEGDINKGLTYIEFPFGQKYEYHTIDDEYNCLYMYWATDLLPEEIDKNIREININISECEINFIGSVTNKWLQFYNICIKNGLKFNRFGATFNIHSKQNVSITENMNLIKKSLLAPALQDDEQVRKQYIFCRIFKNISYGKMGITNNKIVNELFENRLIYETDLDKLFKKGIEFEDNPKKHDIIIELMEYVRDNHTYINRVNTIIKYINEYTKFII